MKFSILQVSQVFLAAAPIAAQQFPTYKTDYASMKLSSQCTEVLNTLVDCPDVLYNYAPQFVGGSLSAQVMSPDAVKAVCIDKCRASLAALQDKIKQACSASDRMVHDGYSYPATYMADIYLFGYTLSCHKDKGTGKPCDLLFNDWRAKPEESHDCDYCAISSLQLQLKNPVSYEEDSEEDFKSLTQSCSATGYDYVVPTGYSSKVGGAKPTTTSGPPTGTTSLACPTPYTVKDGDSCDSLSQAKNVSTFGLIETNGFMMPCQPLTAGKNMCLPLTCRTHLLSYGESCYTLGQLYGVTLAQLINWNDNFDLDCQNIGRWVGTYICVGGVGSPTTTTLPTAAPAPTNAAPHSNQNCASWHTVEKDEYCAKIASNFNLPLDDFYFLNPDLDTACTKLILGEAYCVKAVSDITKYPGYPTDESSTLFPKPTVNATLPSPTVLPHGPGTDSDCSTYQNWVDDSDVQDDFGKEILNKCTTFTAQYQILFDNLTDWNPSLDKDSKLCKLQKGYSYCVQKSSISNTTTGPTSLPTSTTTTTTSTSSTPTSSAPPSPTQDGIAANCKKFYKAQSRDTCDSIVKSNRPATLNLFYKWNPAVKNDCSGLWAGYYYCVGVQ